MSHTIKALSDTGVAATIVLVGVADDINTLVEEHASITRNISEIKMPRMSIGELNVILTSRYDKVGMTIDGDARWKIVTLSRGLPEFVHSLGRAAALHAISEKRMKIIEADVDPTKFNLIVKLTTAKALLLTYRRRCSPAPTR